LLTARQAKFAKHGRTTAAASADLSKPWLVKGLLVSSLALSLDPIMQQVWSGHHAAVNAVGLFTQQTPLLPGLTNVG